MASSGFSVALRETTVAIGPFADEERGGRSRVRNRAADRAAQVEHHARDRAPRSLVELLADRGRRRRREGRDLDDRDVALPRRADRRRLEARAADRERHALLVAAAEEDELARGALGALESRLDLPERRVAQGLAVDRVDEVARLDAGLLGRRARQGRRRRTGSRRGARRRCPGSPRPRPAAPCRPPSRRRARSRRTDRARPTSRRRRPRAGPSCPSARRSWSGSARRRRKRSTAPASPGRGPSPRGRSRPAGTPGRRARRRQKADGSGWISSWRW